MSDVKLKACPFCGGHNLKSGGDDKIVGTWCLDCEAIGPNEYGSKAAWNTRSHDARLIEALEVIAQWADAYPIDIFPEPDFKKAREGLESVGITLDAVSASNMRYVVNGVGEIAKRALSQAREDGE